MITKLISGHQTGADIAAIDFGLEYGVEVGGTVPKGRKWELGRIPDKYVCVEHSSNKYPPRTAENVKNSDFTLLLHFGPLEAESGCALTLKLLQQYNKPHMASDLSVVSDEECALFLKPIVQGDVYKTMNVAGPRASKSPTIYSRTKNILKLAWAK